MSGHFVQRRQQPSEYMKYQSVPYEQDDQTEGSSCEDRVSFPFLPTPSGNLKVIPQQVVYESKQLSIVAADPRRTKVNIKTDGSRKDMSGMEKKVFMDQTSPIHKMKTNAEDIREDVPGSMLRRMEMFAKMPPPPSRMFRPPQGQPDGDSPSDDADLFVEHGRPDNSQLDKKQVGNRTVAQLQHEMNLTKMGFNQDTSIDWAKIDLPPKTDLHKLLHYRISNYINPDVLVKIGNHEYRCHLLVLQCYSGFFVEKAMSRIEIPEQSVTKTAFTYIYDWMLHLGGDSYTLLRRDNILEIFMAAQYLQVKELEEQCWAFIDNEDLFSEDKAFMLYLDARALGNTAVMELMVPRIQRFFLTLVASKDFLELVIEEVSVFLRSNYICIHCEMEVFMAAVRWLMFDWEKRQKFLLDVMSCVRFGLISPWQLVDIRRNPENQEFLLVTRNPDVSGMIEDGLAYAIIKYWYGHESTDYSHWIEVLGLTEPTARNWAGTYKVSDQKKYNTYQEFLSDLSKYRHMHVLSNKGNGDRRGGSNESLQSELENARKPLNPTDFIMPHPR
ncbi:uncharacterized protein LOC124359542 isoform X1 [Homalodisca vitripennis]|uniref:uncharacterized protein LOC124359542 isoform X1 n=2 Tax=Homalodisca vitripennis TaxID=197043 RepID=UPI001EEC7D7B|nr:uncharacterized protein LOC124359542 isoform X1 [Homalodisca vitripennis]